MAVPPAVQEPRIAFAAATLNEETAIGDCVHVAVACLHLAYGTGFWSGGAHLVHRAVRGA